MSDHSTMGSIGKQITDYLKMLIEQNRFNPNFKLPSQNQLARQFQSSRSPVKKALADLRDQGLIYTVHGKGAFIKQDERINNEFLMHLIIPHIDTPFMWNIVKGIRDFVSEKDIRLLINLTEDNPEIEEKAINYYTNQAFSGLLLYPIINATYHDALLKLALSKSPVVVIAHYLPGIRFSSIHCDNYRQIFNAGMFLIEKGHTNIGFIGESDKYNNEIYKVRIAAFRDCVKNNLGENNARVLGVEIPPHKVDEQIKAKIGMQINRFINDNEKMTAVIVSGILAEKVVDCLNSGVNTDPPISVIIIDEPENLHKFNNKNIFIIDQNPYEIGRRAALQLYDQIVNGKPCEEIILQDEIISSSKMIERHARTRQTITSF